MKSLYKKSLIIALALFLSATVFAFVQTDTEPESKKEKAESDTARIQEGQPPSKGAKIRVDDEGIHIRTEEGDEFEVDEMDLEGGMVIDEEGIITDEEGVGRRPRKVYTISHDIVKTGRDIAVEEYEEVDGDVVAVGGDVTVKGVVTGSVMAMGGDVLVKSTAIIEGDAVSIGGKVEREAGAVIRGQRVGVSFFPDRIVPHVLGVPPKPVIRFPPFFGGFGGLALFARIIKIMLFLFLGIVVISILPRNVAKVKDKVREDFLKSALVGLAAEILILPIFVLLIVTIIGIPVALLLEPLLILAAFILGYTGISYFIGEKLREGTSLKPDTPMMTLVIGILAVESVLLLARVVGIFGHFLFGFSWILTFIGWVIWYVAITVGFGASILTRLGTRPRELKLAEVPAEASDSTESDNKST
jgi:hypothetical protein